MMTLSAKQSKIIHWTARIAAAIIFLLGLPFYFGYGNPLPFVDPTNTLHTNVWLSVFPLVFIGLVLGWWKPMWGGLLIIVPLLAGFSLALIGQGFSWIMYVPFFIGIAYIVVGYTKVK